MSRTSYKRSTLVRSNRALACSAWGVLSKTAAERLKELTRQYGFSVAAGDLQLLDGAWYVTQAGLLRLSARRRCGGIRTTLVACLSDPAASRWVFKATAHTAGPRSFVGYGDADRSNVSPLVRGAEMRVAETRAVNRALRKAYGIGLCSVEELGYLSSRPEPFPPATGTAQSHSNGNNSSKGNPRLRDRLWLLIRQHQLDPTLVKRFAADFCGTQELREARRDLVESFITHLADWAAKDHAGLVCKLNSYAQSQEVQH